MGHGKCVWLWPHWVKWVVSFSAFTSQSNYWMYAKVCDFDKTCLRPQQTISCCSLCFSHKRNFTVPCSDARNTHKKNSNQACHSRKSCQGNVTQRLYVFRVPSLGNKGKYNSIGWSVKFWQINEGVAAAAWYEGSRVPECRCGGLRNIRSYAQFCLKPKGSTDSYWKTMASVFTHNTLQPQVMCDLGLIYDHWNLEKRWSRVLH